MKNKLIIPILIIFIGFLIGRAIRYSYEYNSSNYFWESQVITEEEIEKDIDIQGGTIEDSSIKSYGFVDGEILSASKLNAAFDEIVDLINQTD